MKTASFYIMVLGV